uniref:30S ribosomal protein S13 n=1 Tax=Nephromyces sp. ex Molgula occidentalis TaxID=2544991 RepID=A0A5C1H879_9APIC|nr:30S ribosomal protein S13 [Nephromyces sp. ex Molgula occidentalis]
MNINLIICNYVQKSKGLAQYNKNLLTLINHLTFKFKSNNKEIKINWLGFKINLFRLQFWVNTRLVREFMKQKKFKFNNQSKKGLKLKNHLPIRGQKTKTNAKTALKLNYI